METHCYAGFSVSPFYDPMLAKLIVRADTREAAVAKLAVALAEFNVGGIATNIPFLQRLVDSEGYRTGDFNTAFVPRFLGQDH